jgi:hypothetical protein
MQYPSTQLSAIHISILCQSMQSQCYLSYRKSDPGRQRYYSSGQDNRFNFQTRIWRQAFHQRSYLVTAESSLKRKRNGKFGCKICINIICLYVMLYIFIYMYMFECLCKSTVSCKTVDDIYRKSVDKVLQKMKQTKTERQRKNCSTKE